CHAAHGLRALPVVEALARQVHGLAAGDALDDEGGVLVDQDAHAATPWIFSTARRAASCMETERSQYSTPYFSRILTAGSWPSSRQALITPRATMSTRVLETIDIITAILSTPGFCSTSLASPAAFRTDGLPPISQ